LIATGAWLPWVLIDGQDAGPELIKQGLCWVYEKYLGEASGEIQTTYRDAQDAAQAERAGLWQEPDPVPPWEWRKEKRVRLEGASSL